MNDQAGNDAGLGPSAAAPRRSWLRLTGWALCLIPFVVGLAVARGLCPRSVIPLVFVIAGIGFVLLMVRNGTWLTVFLGTLCSLAGAALAELWLPADGGGKVLLGHILGAIGGVCLGRVLGRHV
jgi:hypothetical protein